MTHESDDSELEATREQLSELREMGVIEQDLQGMSFADAEALIEELRAEHEAGRRGGL